MCLKRNRDLRSLFLPVLTGLLAITAGASSQAQQFPNQGTANYNWGVPYGSNYNYGFMRYGQGGFGGSSYNPMMQSQPNLGMGTAPYGGYGPAAAENYQGANPNNQEAAAQAMQNQRQMQAMELRFDVRKKTPKTVQSKERQANKLLTRNQVLSSDGKVLWPARAPATVSLASRERLPRRPSRPPSRSSRTTARPRSRTSSRPRICSTAYGHPALDKAARQSRQAAQSLHISFSAWSGQSIRWAASEDRFQGLTVGPPSNWASVLARVCSRSSTWMIFPWRSIRKLAGISSTP